MGAVFMSRLYHLVSVRMADEKRELVLLSYRNKLPTRSIPVFVTTLPSG
jgi:hypothetical protein